MTSSAVTTNGTTPPLSLSSAATALNGIGSSARFRHRKISLKQTLRVIWEKDVPHISENIQREVLGVETGVEKGEEEEHHLQAVINANTAALNDKSVKRVFIPTPSASTKWNDYEQYYKPGWSEPESYIRSSATVDDAAGCPYCIDERDDEFLTNVLNKDVTEPKQQCSEDEFEMISYLLDSTVQEKQPFLATDPNLILSFKELEQAIIEGIDQRKREAKQDPLNLDRLLIEAKTSLYAQKYTPSPYRTVTASFKLFGEKIYNHWRERKIERMGKSVFPSLKFETDVTKDDNDPYVCFRRREIRQTRKTRRTDQQSSERLRRLRSEMEQAQNLFKLIAKREQVRLHVIQTELDLFEYRCKFKAVKRKFRIAGDDEDLVSQPKRSRKEEAARLKREEREKEKAAQKERENEKAARAAASSAVNASREARAAALAEKAAHAQDKERAGLAPSRIPDLAVVTIEAQQDRRHALLQSMIDAKLKEIHQKDAGWTHISDRSHVPWLDFYDPPLSRYEHDVYTSERKARMSSTSNHPTLEPQYPPSYASSQDVPKRDTSVFDVLQTSNKMEVEPVKAVDQLKLPRLSAGSFRKRVGRNGMVYIDRKGMITAPSKPSDRAAGASDEGSTESDARFKDRHRFDNDNDTQSSSNVFGDIAKLNGLPQSVQRLRFGAMLTANSYEVYQHAHDQRRKAAMAASAALNSRQQQLQQRQRQQQQQQMANGQAQSKPQGEGANGTKVNGSSQPSQSSKGQANSASNSTGQAGQAGQVGQAGHNVQRPRLPSQAPGSLIANQNQSSSSNQSSQSTTSNQTGKDKKQSVRTQQGWAKPPLDGSTDKSNMSAHIPKVETTSV